MEFRLQAEYFVTEHVRLKAELHTYFACSVINSEPILQLHLLLFLKSPLLKRLCHDNYGDLFGRLPGAHLRRYRHLNTTMR